MTNVFKPTVLVILDGWGHRENKVHNAIAAANTPNWNKLWQTYPHTLIEGSGHAVGLPNNQMGNSEVGHLTMGAGRIVYQELTRIDKEIADGDFFTNSVLTNTIKTVQIKNKALHILGLLSPGGVHSHEQHIHAMIKLAAKQGLKNIYLHAFLDGRDTPPQSAKDSLVATEQLFQQLGCGQIASIVGRFYAMDRDKRWERVEKAYHLLTLGQAEYHADSAVKGLDQAYARGETDEFVQPTVITSTNGMPVNIKDGDAVVFMNFRADRARQLTRALIEPEFTGFKRQYYPQLSSFVSLTEYAKDIATTVAYPPQNLAHVLGEFIAEQGLPQLRIAETEKYAHVTFFFNGGIETPFKNEKRILIPSAKITTYDLNPAMSAEKITEEFVKAIHSQQYALIVCNFANPDMVGHTGNFDATVTAIETIDSCLGKITHALQAVNGEAIITADHGNAECMYDETTQQAHTAHTSDPVPFIYIGRPATITHNNGTLADIAPTLLMLMGLPQPTEMTGLSLIKLENTT